MVSYGNETFQAPPPPRAKLFSTSWFSSNHCVLGYLEICDFILLSNFKTYLPLLSLGKFNTGPNETGMREDYDSAKELNCYCHVNTNKTLHMGIQTTQLDLILDVLERPKSSLLRCWMHISRNRVELGHTSLLYCLRISCIGDPNCVICDIL